MDWLSTGKTMWSAITAECKPSRSPFPRQGQNTVARRGRTAGGEIEAVAHLGGSLLRGCERVNWRMEDVWLDEYLPRKYKWPKRFDAL